MCKFFSLFFCFNNARGISSWVYRTFVYETQQFGFQVYHIITHFGKIDPNLPPVSSTLRFPIYPKYSFILSPSFQFLLPLPILGKFCYSFLASWFPFFLSKKSVSPNNLTRCVCVAIIFIIDFFLSSCSFSVCHFQPFLFYSVSCDWILLFFCYQTSLAPDRPPYNSICKRRSRKREKENGRERREDVNTNLWHNSKEIFNELLLIQYCNLYF